MDQDSVILKYIQKETDSIDDGINEIECRNSSREQTLDDFDNRLDEIYARLNMKKRNILPIEVAENSSEPSVWEYSAISYDEL
ncbi:hypothetical protein PSTEL_04330 [Paenibacillus stellifer]|uniref:Uncharacterized protein n=1 Tax=Paenibacillus stellifer TaxID=169760 RepID=A0A089LQU5_9BACL|nr:hypothetical protein [Paenibacillus stellifer]AIQ62450.1 hypothetical protein PSTEL_04330 [Paenibacillus stellifer]